MNMCPSLLTPRMRSKIKFCSQYGVIICKMLHRTPFCYSVAPRHFNCLSQAERGGSMPQEGSPATIRNCCDVMSCRGRGFRISLPCDFAAPVWPRCKTLPACRCSHASEVCQRGGHASALCGGFQRQTEGCSRIFRAYGSELRMQQFR